MIHSLDRFFSLKKYKKKNDLANMHIEEMGFKQGIDASDRANVSKDV